MYCQILVHPSQTCLQRILWRKNPTDIVLVYEMLTVTYGTASAASLANGCIDDLAERNAVNFPIGAKHIKRGCYIDDVLTGADTLQEAIIVRDQVIQLLRLGCFEFSKWASNCPELIKPVDNQNSEPVTINGDMDTSILGIQWNQSKDTFSFLCTPDPSHNVITKRTILLEVSRLFDPLGLLGPIVVIAKLIIQDLWQSGVHWDESVPQNIHTRWCTLRSQLPAVDQLQIPRGVKSNTSQLIQLHEFCDASECAYLVAPLKAVTLARLELSAALLLAELMDKTSKTLELMDIQRFYWLDASIVLNWISSQSRRWSVFVSNRVGEIQRLTEISDWHHVTSANNPADILSRGLNSYELANSSMWWHGPSFLQLNDNDWPSSSFVHLENDLPEQRKVVTNAATVDECLVTKLLSERSSLNKICRIIAYCLRFCRAYRPSTPTKIITPSEIALALRLMCKVMQKQAFSSEYKALSQGKPISTSSGLLSLSPYMDETGVMRVGGRLKNSNLPIDACYPILLPRSHDLTRHVIEYEHVRNMHTGAQATMAAIRQRFWPLALRSAVRRVIQKCVTCFKSKPLQSQAMMGSLPASRVTVSRPFSRTGIDYAGPVILREGKRRNARNHKAYIAIFVCFATKAVHIELVSDLTSDAFLAAFKRFISRRGKPSHMYSDNGTTFVGAQKQLKELYDFYLKQTNMSQIEQFCSEQEISWNFIPPNAPHFGGLWEAAVKSAKFHMTRIVGKVHLTFEELQTVLCEIEAILNSRPLTQLSSDPNDLNYLTPDHFLIGTALNSFPCSDLSDVNENRLMRWQRVEQIRQHFWRRWSDEYLHSLQERSKWQSNTGIQLEPNQLVLIKQQNLAPLQWTPGRVQEVHPGSDNIARTATIKTSKSSFVRPLSRLAILPIDPPSIAV
ncbi:uncharacterized protein [Temnothorax longispinosus]|uniref:uncharacterized protein n=1 Tax=Temnothorax longispinosus TaxID=300112 RepID=UPI003A9A5410